MHNDSFAHGRRSIRLRGYDYSMAGAYFVTICVRWHECLFGEVVDGEMRLNPLGQIAADEWLRSARIRQEIDFDQWVVMPNHVHGLVLINDIVVGAHGRGRQPDTRSTGAPSPGEPFPVTPEPGTAVLAAPLPGTSLPTSLLRKPKSLGSFVAGYKSAVTTRINTTRGTQGAAIWQRNFFEHIVRNEREWIAVAGYIRNNPANWRSDSDNPTNPLESRPPTTGDQYWRDAGL